MVAKFSLPAVFHIDLEYTPHKQIQLPIRSNEFLSKPVPLAIGCWRENRLLLMNVSVRDCYGNKFPK